MYCTKPGSIVHAVFFLILALAGSLARKEKKAALCAAGSMLAFCAVSAVFWCLARFAFGYSGSLLSIYGTQLGEEDLHLDVFAISVLKYPFYFILACGIIGFIFFISVRIFNVQSLLQFWDHVVQFGHPLHSFDPPVKLPMAQVGPSVKRIAPKLAIR